MNCNLLFENEIAVKKLQVGGNVLDYDYSKAWQFRPG